MEQEDLIKKLENLETPEIELRGHRQALKAALLNSGRFRERPGIGWVRIVAPVAAAVVLIVVVGFLHLVQPGLHMAQAREIARNDPHVQALMEEHNLHIADVKLQDGEAFVVLTRCHLALYGGTSEGIPEGLPKRIIPDALEPTCAPGRPIEVLFRVITSGLFTTTDDAAFPPPPSAPDETDLSPMDELLRGYVLQVDLRQKTVSGIGEVERVAPLAQINLEAIEFVGPDQAGDTAPHDSSEDQE